ncbi:MAG TPA: hypothetical protein PK634_13470, partial [Kiritimatiellia bacterium]|nr:hypothetical protein [Kiritimatiellia bacterium]
MGQKVNPIGFRVSVNKDWRSRWYAEKRQFGDLLHEDLLIRELVKKYSDFIAYPIRFGEKGEAPKEDAEALNTMKALWKRAKS